MQPHVLRVWVAEELRRSRNAWAPVRLLSHNGTAVQTMSADQSSARAMSVGNGAGGAGVNEGPEEMEGEGNGEEEQPDLSRVVDLDDIRVALLPIRVRVSLVSDMCLC